MVLLEMLLILLVIPMIVATQAKSAWAKVAWFFGTVAALFFVAVLGTAVAGPVGAILAVLPVGVMLYFVAKGSPQRSQASQA